MTYTYSYPNLPGIWVKKQINNSVFKNMFKWYEVGILGCGPRSDPWIDLEKYINWPNNINEITNELTQQLSMAGHRPGGGTCLLPEHLNGYHFITHYEYFVEKYVPVEIRNTFTTYRDLDAWVATNLGKPIWECALILKKQPDHSIYWTGKHSPGAEWQDPEIQRVYNYSSANSGVTGKINGPIPITKQWINSLESHIFKHIGRVLVYANKVGHAVPTHRDFPINSFGHSAHFVNIQLTTSSRKAFVYDEVTKEKIYTTSRAYMFNESDCHGVDAEDDQHFTIRIDGEFQDWLQWELKFKNGQIFSKEYDSVNKLKNLTIINPEDN